MLLEKGLAGDRRRRNSLRGELRGSRETEHEIAAGSSGISIISTRATFDGLGNYVVHIYFVARQKSGV